MQASGRLGVRYPVLASLPRFVSLSFASLCFVLFSVACVLCACVAAGRLFACWLAGLLVCLRGRGLSSVIPAPQPELACFNRTLCLAACVIFAMWFAAFVLLVAVYHAHLSHCFATAVLHLDRGEQHLVPSGFEGSQDFCCSQVASLKIGELFDISLAWT